MISSTKRYLFAAILGTAALLTLLCANAFADADSISINFGSHFGAPTGGTLGAYPVDWSYWNNAISDYSGINEYTASGATQNAYNKAGTFTSMLSSNGFQTPVTGTWNSKNSYRYSATRPSTDNNAILYYGYLDDGDSNNSVSMTSPYFAYDIYYYPSTDGALSFRHATIGGSSLTALEYGGNGTTTIPTKNYWGTPVNADIANLTEGVNYLKVSSSYPTVYVKGSGNENSHRGSFGALQIVNTADSQAVAVTGNFTWTDSVWSNDLTGETDQPINANAVGYRIINNGTDAAVNLGGATVNLSNVKLLGTGKITFSDGTVALGKTNTVYDFADYGGEVVLPAIGQIAPQGVVKFNSNVSVSGTSANQNVIPGAYFVNGSTVSLASVENGAIIATPTVSSVSEGANLNVTARINDNAVRTLNSLTSSADYVNNNALTITSGMMILQNKNHWVQGGGTITSGYQNANGEYDLYLCGLGTTDDMRVDSSTIVDNPNGKVNLIKTGNGTVSISRATRTNTYSGKTVVLEGKLQIGEAVRSTEFYIAPNAQLDFSARNYKGDLDFPDVDHTATSLTGYGRMQIGNNNGKISLTLNNVVNDGSCFNTVFAYGKAFTLNDSQFHTQWLHSTTNITLNGDSEIYSNEFWGRGAGVLTINDNSKFTATTIFQLGTGAAAASAGTVVKAVQNGGEVNLGNLGIGHFGNYDASYEMNAGVLNVGDSVTMNGAIEFKDIWLAVSSSGTFLHKGGTVNAGGIDMKTRDNNAMIGTYTMTGGTLNLGKRGFYRNVEGNYAINLEGGTITAGSADLPESQRGNWSSALNATLTGTNSGDADTRVTFAPAAESTITWSGILSGNGGLIVNGEGTVVLSANNTYTGDTTVKAGTLTLNKTGQTGTLAPGAKVIVDGANAVLAASGDALGYKSGAIESITLLNGGTFKNNSTSAHITVNNAIYMNNGIITATGNGSAGGGNFIFDNAFHVTGGTDNVISASRIQLRTLEETTFADGDFAGKIDVAQGAKLTILSSINDTSNTPLTKTGEGELVLSGRSVNPNDTFVNAGTLTVQYANGGVGTFAANTAVTVDGSTAVLAGHGDILGYTSGAISSLNLLNGGTFKNDSTNTHITVNNPVFMNNGIITSEGDGSTGGGNFIFDNAFHVTGGTDNVISAPRIQLRALDGTTFAPGDSAGMFDVAEGAKLTILSSINDTSNTPLIKTGDGELVLTNNSPFNKNVTINGGILDLTEGKLYAGAYVGNANVYVNDGGILKVNNFGYSEGGRASLGGLTYQSNGSTNFHFNGGTVLVQETFAEPIGRNIELQQNGGTFDIAEDVNLTLSANIHGAGSLTKAGAGQLELTYANAYTGGTAVNDGKLLVSGSGSLGTGAITVSEGAELEFNVDNGDVKKTASITGKGSILKTGNGTLQINNDGIDESVECGNITAQAGRLDVKGVYNGTLVVDAPAIFSPGNSIGTLQTDVFKLNAGATLLMEQDATGMDKLIANTFDIDDDAIIEFAFTSLQPGATYEIFNDPQGLEGQYADVNFWSSFLSPADAYYWNLSVDAFSVFASVDSNAVPEPSTWALLILGAAGLLYWRKKK